MEFIRSIPTRPKFATRRESSKLRRNQHALVKHWPLSGFLGSFKKLVRSSEILASKVTSETTTKTSTTTTTTTTITKHLPPTTAITRGRYVIFLEECATAVRTSKPGTNVVSGSEYKPLTGYVVLAEAEHTKTR